MTDFYPLHVSPSPYSLPQPWVLDRQLISYQRPDGTISAAEAGPSVLEASQAGSMREIEIYASIKREIPYCDGQVDKTSRWMGGWGEMGGRNAVAYVVATAAVTL